MYDHSNDKKTIMEEWGSVGVDERKFDNEGVLVKIAYKNKYGDKATNIPISFLKTKQITAKKWYGKILH